MYDDRKVAARQDILPILLNQDPLPWVDTVKHLGNKLESDNSMRQDIAMKKGNFIGKVNSLSQEFHFASPDVLLKVIDTYCTSFHGSGLWDLYSNNCERLYKAWNVCMRLTYKLPWTTHRYLIETISGHLHLKVMLASRLVRFLDSLKKCNKLGVRFLAGISEGDLRTVLGQNMAGIAAEVDAVADRLTPGLVKTKLKYFEVPEDQEWRVKILDEILHDNIHGFSFEEIRIMKNYLQRWKKYPNLRTRFAENIWTFVVSQKILTTYHNKIIIKTTFYLDQCMNNKI